MIKFVSDLPQVGGFVSDLPQVGGFLPSTPVSSTNKTDRHDITEILLKMALTTINQTKPWIYSWIYIYIYVTILYVHYNGSAAVPS